MLSLVFIETLNYLGLLCPPFYNTIIISPNIKYINLLIQLCREQTQETAPLEKN